MPNSKLVKSKSRWGAFFAVLLALSLGVYLAACGGGGGSSSSAGGAPPPPPPAPAPAPANVITAFSDAGGGTVTVTSPNTLVVGDVITISGTTNYNGTFTVSSATASSFTITAAFVADDATGSWQLGGGLISGCSTTGATGAITLPAMATVPSRFTGVAPLAVFFDATATTATATTRPFHELEYRWDFGDPAGGAVWAFGSRAGASSKNSATGGVAGHVYETPGTYIVNLIVFDGASAVANSCIQIAVQDPEVVFAGDKTTCFSTSGNFTGCPAGSTQVTTSDFVAVASSVTPLNTVRRLLLRRGETWTAATTAQITATGPGIVGAFGSGSRPVVNTSNPITMMRLSSASTPDMKDWRIMDLSFDGSNQVGAEAVNPSGGIDQITLLRLDIRNLGFGVFFRFEALDFINAGGPPLHHLFDQIAIVDSSTALNIPVSSGALSVYAAAQRFMAIGNSFDNNGGGEHAMRLPYIDRGVISNNQFQGQAPTKAAFTLRASVHGSGGVTGANGNDTRFVVVSDNKFIGAAGSFWTTFYGPKAFADERVVDVITERNWYTAHADTQVGLTLYARDQTIRNNLFDTNGGAAHTGIRIDDALVLSDNIRIYHNSFFSADADNDFAAVRLITSSGLGVTNVTMINNLGYAPSDTQHLMILDGVGGGVVTASNNSTDAQVLSTSPLFTATPPVSPADWKPTAGSYAIGAGAPVPVWSDFFLVSQPTPRDIGAVIH